MTGGISEARIDLEFAYKRSMEDISAMIDQATNVPDIIELFDIVAEQAPRVPRHPLQTAVEVTLTVPVEGEMA